MGPSSYSTEYITTTRLERAVKDNEFQSGDCGVVAEPSEMLHVPLGRK